MFVKVTCFTYCSRLYLCCY